MADTGAKPAALAVAEVVVEKLTKNVNEDHLREIFSTYGQIRDLDIPMNRQFNTNRGTAYILYTSEADAEAAIAHMHEAQIDGAVINVSIVLPRRKFSPSPPLARRGANIDPRGPPIPSNFRGPPPPRRHQDPYHARGLLGVIELVPGHTLLDLALHQDDGAVDGIARDEMLAEEEGARAIVAIAAMMIGAEAEVGPMEEGGGIKL
ncbi:uncharacterized protein BP5553_01455 [Venustampulla echinocandica]|uniref:RRM domain-containing protein n=1 Tax=Venustampulla echinocandica TaxID=2656787 RepID=A0A370U127_9HELO|nr:uncharacterized protein BP5553_01455 [Venustampulla echinocandica]RDL41476.1 hypothetical protein BP5553_01455 [Venustampulla echinocandica]